MIYIHHYNVNSTYVLNFSVILFPNNNYYEFSHKVINTVYLL